MYYVGFSSSVIVASLILFQGFNTTDATNTISLVSGFIVIFIGVHILNLSRDHENMADMNGYGAAPEEDVFVPGHRGYTGRLSIDGWHGIVDNPPAPLNGRAYSTTLFDGTEHVGLSQLREEDETDEDDEDDDDALGGSRTPLRSSNKPQQQV